jgi:hypothetical protein
MFIFKVEPAADPPEVCAQTSVKCTRPLRTYVSVCARPDASRAARTLRQPEALRMKQGPPTPPNGTGTSYNPIGASNPQNIRNRAAAWRRDTAWTRIRKAFGSDTGRNAARYA